MAGELVRAQSITRRFDSRVAVDALSFELSAGEILALLGPNGAGKTTTLRMLGGLILPTRGSVDICGERLTGRTAARLRRAIGMLTETPGLWDRLSVRRNLLTYAHLYNITKPRQAVDRALEIVGVLDRAADLAGSLSKGLRQRVAIARALLHNPQIVLLDEPTAGLDPASARHIRDVIAGLRAEGRAVLMCTHNLTEAESLGDRIAILNTRLLALDEPDALRRTLSGTRVEIDVEGAAGDAATIVKSFTAGGLEVRGAKLVLTSVDANLVPDVIAALVRGGIRIRRVTPEQRSLEDVYLALVNEREEV